MTLRTLGMLLWAAANGRYPVTVRLGSDGEEDCVALQDAGLMTLQSHSHGSALYRVTDAGRARAAQVVAMVNAADNLAERVKVWAGGPTPFGVRGPLPTNHCDDRFDVIDDAGQPTLHLLAQDDEDAQVVAAVLNFVAGGGL